VETVEFLSQICSHNSLRSQIHVKKFICLLNSFFFIRKI